MKNVAVFLDFQGTIGGNGTDNILSLKLYPFSAQAIKLLNDSNILVIGITNQSQISKGNLTIDEYYAKLADLKKELKTQNAHFDEVYCCPHRRKDNCSCKKPNTGMIDMACNDYLIDLSKSYVIGDMGKNDMVLAKNIGAKGILVLTGVGKNSLEELRSTWADVEPTYIADNVLEAAKMIISDIIKKAPLA